MVLQVGKETTLGTAVSAGKKLLSFEVDMDPNIPAEMIQSAGSMAPTGVVVGKERTNITLKSKAAAYDDLLYLWATCLKAPAITTPSGGTNTRLWTFTPNTTDTNTANSLTMEFGNSTNAYKVAGGRVDDLELTYKPDGTVEANAKLIGQAISEGITMTSSPTDITLRPISPKQVNFYIDTSAGNIGTTQVKPFEIKFKLGNRWTDVYEIDSSTSTWATLVEHGLMPEIQFTLPHDSSANTYMDTYLRAGATLYVAVKATGSLIEGSLYYKSEIYMPIVLAKNARGPKYDVHSSTFTGHAIYDTTLTYAIKVLHHTQLTAL